MYDDDNYFSVWFKLRIDNYVIYIIGIRKRLLFLNLFKINILFSIIFNNEFL